MPLPLLAAGAAAAAPAAGKAAGTAGAAAAGGAAGKGGLGAFLASPGGQAAISTGLGMIAGGSPQSAAGVRTGMGAFSMLQGLSDRGSVAKAMEGYSDVVSGGVRREVMDRQMNEAIVSLGAEDPSGGPARTIYEGQPIETLKAHEAAVATLPATARANPQGAGYMLAGLARGAPTPTARPPQGKTLYEAREELLDVFPGHELSARMTDKGYALEASAPTEEAVEPAPAQFTREELATARETMSELPPGVTETISVLGPGGAGRKITGKGEVLGGGSGGGPVAGATGFGTVNPLAGQLPYDRSTGEAMPITEEMWAQIRRLLAAKDAGGIAGTIVRNPDGTTTIRR